MSSAGLMRTIAWIVQGGSLGGGASLGTLPIVVKHVDEIISRTTRRTRMASRRTDLFSRNTKPLLLAAVLRRLTGEAADAAVEERWKRTNGATARSR